MLDWASKAQAYDQKRSSVDTGLINLLDALAYGKSDVKLMARKFSNMQIVPSSEIPELRGRISTEQ